MKKIGNSSPNLQNIQHWDLCKSSKDPGVGIFGFSDKLLYGGEDGGKALCNHNTLTHSKVK